MFAKFEAVDSHTLRVERADGGVEYFGFMMDVSSFELCRGASHVTSKFDDLHIHYGNCGQMCQSDIGRLHDVSMCIRDNVMGDFSLKTPFPSPKGIEAIAFVLTREWGKWRGVEVADDGVCVAAMKDLQTHVEEGACNETSLWKGLTLDFESIAMSRAIVKSPTSYILMAYVAHLASAPVFQYEHFTNLSAFDIGDARVAPLFTQAHANAFVAKQAVLCKERFARSHGALLAAVSVTEQRGRLVVRTRNWGAALVWAVLLSVCGGCVAGPYGAGADDVLSEVLRNFGMVVVPLVFVAFAGCGMSGAAFRVTKDVADFNPNDIIFDPNILTATARRRCRCLAGHLPLSSSKRRNPTERVGRGRF